MRKFIVRTTVWIVFLAIVLFGAAGTIRWTPGWIYIGFLAVMSFASGPWLARHDPDLFRERLGSFFQKEQKGWDKLWMIPMLVVWLGGLMLMALDGGRYHWSQVPLWLQVVGFILICAGFWLSMLTFKANSYAAPVVKVQKERGHKVVTTGPYAYVRHPMYLGALLFSAGTTLLFGSWWIVVGACRRCPACGGNRCARSSGGGNAQGRARRLCRLRGQSPLPAHSPHMVALAGKRLFIFRP